MAKTNIFESNWVDLVFTGKNKAYGAFELRKKNNHYTVIAILLAILSFGLAISGPVIVNYIKGVVPETEEEIVIQEVQTLEEPPPVDEKEPPPPPAPPPPPLKQTIQYTPPVIKKDEEVKEENPPIQEEVKEETVSTKTDSGSKDGIDPTLLDQPTGDLTGGNGDENQIVDWAEQEAEYPGGMDQLLTDIKKNFVYPPIAVENQTQGTVRIKFVVEKDGSVSNPEIVSKPLGDGIEEEAIRVVKHLPHKFTPAKNNGRPARIRIVVPLKLKLK